MSVHLPPRPSRPSSRSMMRVSVIMSSVSAMPETTSHISKTVEEIAMKKPKTVTDLLAVADVCIEAFESRARLLESRGKGLSKRRDDREVNTAE
jgi:hypothetical protein